MTVAMQEVNAPVDSPTDDTGSPHVLFVIDQFAKTLGGGERAALQLASRLSERGLQVSILTFLIHPECPAVRMATVPIYVLPVQRTFAVEGFQAALELRRFLKRKKIQIVQTFFESSDLWAGLVSKATTSGKLVWSRRDMGILRTWKHGVTYRLMAGVPDAVFAVSNSVREHCIHVDRIRPSRVHTIYNGLNLARFEGAPRPVSAPGQELITSVGNIRRVKGHDIFIRAAAIIAKQYPNVQFSIAGETLEQDYFQELRVLVETLKLTSQFHFDGGITDLPGYLARASIFVLPSRSEGFSNAIIEAMAASLPVVATKVGGNPEAVEDGVTGFVVPPENPAALADAILRLLSDPKRSESMGEAGRRLAMRKFSTETVVNQVIDVYRSLLSTK
jgi:glycosyltransferase involved in cell wall biosynthesis